MDLFWFTQPCTTKGKKVPKDKEISDFKALLGNDIWTKTIGDSKLEIVKVKSAVKKDIDVLMSDSKPIFFKDGKSSTKDWFLSLQLGLVLPKFYNPIVVSSTRWKNIEQNGILTKEDVFNGEKPFENYPSFDSSKISFVFYWNKENNLIFGPVGIAVPTQMFHNYNDRIYPLRSLGVVMMTRGKDYFCGSLETARYTIQELLEIGNKFENDDTVDDSSLISEENMIKDMTIQDEDEKLHICFLTAIKYLLKDSSLLPMDLGYFFQQYVQKCVPDKEKIDLKKTSYSKLSKYIEKINENSEGRKLINIVNIKDKISIKSVDFQNKLISDFEPIYGIPNENDENSEKPSFSIYSCFLSTKSFRKFFSDVDPCVKDENTPYTHNDLTKLLLKYFEINNYSIENNKVTIKNDLEKFLEIDKKLVDTPQTVNSIVLLLQKKCTQGYVMKKPDNSIIVKKGAIPNIRVHFEKASHKEVTIFRNLQLFDLLNDSFVSCLKRYYASSAGIHEGKKRCTGETVVQLQGNQLKSIKKFFQEKYGLEGKYIKIE
uniref:SUI1 domain-containing protein n=1 Tax=Strongyloides papillosus TaxID=174720 RepID=A0A0N5BNR7_STREA